MERESAYKTLTRPQQYSMVLLLGGLVAAGCAGKTINDILADPQRYANQDVEITGNVVESFSVVGKGFYRSQGEELDGPHTTAHYLRRVELMAVIKVIEVLGVSDKSWEDAAHQALQGAHSSVRNITGLDLVSQTDPRPDLSTVRPTRRSISI